MSNYGGRILRGSSEVSFQTWRDALRKIQSEKARLKENRNIMTPYEQKSLLDGIEATKQNFSGGIVNGMIGELLDYGKRIQSHEKIVKAYQKKEAEDWDAPKMELAYKSVGARVRNACADPIQASAEIARIYKDCQNSKFELRAFAEIVPELARNNHDAQLNRLSIDAQAKLRELRETPEIQAQKIALNETIVKFGELRKEARVVHQEIYDFPLADVFNNNPLSKTINRFTWKDGELEILEENDPAVSGIFWGENLEVKGG